MDNLTFTKEFIPPFKTSLQALQDTLFGLLGKQLQCV
jgi:hypothetical protein